MPMNMVLDVPEQQGGPGNSTTQGLSSTSSGFFLELMIQLAKNSWVGPPRYCLGEYSPGPQIPGHIHAAIFQNSTIPI